MPLTQLDHKIAQLKKLYSEGKLIPFIGSGLSYPFDIPTWEGLIKELLCYVPDKLQPSIEFDLETHDYWSAVDNIKKYANFSEFEVQEKVKDLIENRVKKEVNIEDHNYGDLGKMKFNTFLTTNYDDLLYQYLEGEKYYPIDLSSATVKSTELHNTDRKKRIWHLHGSLSNTGSIVLSREGYKQVYSQEKYRTLFSTLLGNNTLLFLGFSFEDQYIKQLIKDYKPYFNNTHYILLSNPSAERIRELKEECGLEVIPLYIKDSTRVKEIRKLLQAIDLHQTSTNTSMHSSEANELKKK
ncbi:SIR2 family NAD-dependent protein deacylase [Brevibacillus brevis]|uniref:SIR2 family NAD-dependent protein deacylase n=1 Tax=Brevibacillus brevis TaxID=1393 RepID=UPI0018FF44EF|nr:SIR2 family protein [Brevibacillus brevis]